MIKIDKLKWMQSLKLTQMALAKTEKRPFICLKKVSGETMVPKVLASLEQHTLDRIDSKNNCKSSTGRP